MIHGFQAGHGTGTDYLEANPIQQLISTRDTVLHNIFLYLNKMYNNLDKYRCLKTLPGYVRGPRALRILQTYWYWIIMVANSGGYYAPPLKGIP